MDIMKKEYEGKITKIQMAHLATVEELRSKFTLTQNKLRLSEECILFDIEVVSYVQYPD